MFLVKFPKFTNWSQGNSPAQEESKGLWNFLAEQNQFIGKYYIIRTLQVNSEKFLNSHTSRLAVTWIQMHEASEGYLPIVMQTVCKAHLYWTLNTQLLSTLYSRCDVESLQVKNIQNWIQKLANLRWDVLTSNQIALHLTERCLVQECFQLDLWEGKKKHGAGVMFDIFTKRQSCSGNSLGIICGGRKVWNFDFEFLFLTRRVCQLAQQSHNTIQRFSIITDCKCRICFLHDFCLPSSEDV